MANVFALGFDAKFQAKLGQIVSSRARAMVEAGADEAQDIMDEIAHNWNRKPKVSVTGNLGVINNNYWNTISYQIVVNDPVQINGVSRFSILNNGANTSPNGVYPKNGKKKLKFQGYYYPKLDGGPGDDGSGDTYYLSGIEPGMRRIRKFDFIGKYFLPRKAQIKQAIVANWKGS